MSEMDLGRLVRSDASRVVSVEYREPGKALLYRRDGDAVSCEAVDYEPWLLVCGEELAKSLPDSSKIELLTGAAAGHNVRVSFPDLASYDAALKELSKKSRGLGRNALKPYRAFTDMGQQMLTGLGIRLFRDMDFDDIRRMQLDIETHCDPSHTFSDPETETDEVILVSIKDSHGFETYLSSKTLGGEKNLLKAMIDIIKERDPDAIEGHNIHNFDLKYLETRCKRHKVKFALGRDNKVAKARASRLSVGERMVNYTRYDIPGRHVVDTYHLVMLYDVSYRGLDSYGLKSVARHFGVAAPNRTYVDPSKISELYESNPEMIAEYCLDDVRETDAISRLLSPSYFYQAQLIPFGYQNCIVRGNATRIDALLVAEYLRAGAGLPTEQAVVAYQGALSEVLATGVFRPIWHIDVRSLYPSIVISEQLTPESDWRGEFLRLLTELRAFRLAAKDAVRRTSGAERARWSALQNSFKILINSFYGYTGFVGGTFNDFGLASKITARGREILSGMRDFLVGLGVTIVEMDTDGIYFRPGPDHTDAEAMEALVQAQLPAGIEVELDATYQSMFSYKAKNYALLDEDGKVTISGAALKSRGLEEFQRRFVQEYVTLLLTGREDELDALYEKYVDDIEQHRLPLKDFAKREYLSMAPKTYADKLEKGETKRSAAYELVLKAEGREYKQGDGVEFYVTGNKKSVSVTDFSKLLVDADESVRDENIPFYLDKLQKLHQKFQEALT